MRAPTTPAGRLCTRCRDYLPLDAFRVNTRMRDGLSSWCRPCFVARNRIWRGVNREAVNARRRVAG